MKQKLLTGTIVLMMAAGIGLMLYPTVSNYILSLQYHKTITDFKETVSSMDSGDREKLLEDARAYNERLARKSAYMHDLTEDELDEYYSLLDPSDTGVMGYIAIPSIGVQLPIYHGTSDAVLQDGVGHIAGTSFPVGGDGTHCILSGHRGMVSSKLFTDIDKLKAGDRFVLYILDNELVYEVDRVKTILPAELGLERIEQDEDRCTLLTCTPYGVNTHRLLVQGVRVYGEGAAETYGDEVAFHDVAEWLVICMGTAVSLIWLISVISLAIMDRKH